MSYENIRTRYTKQQVAAIIRNGVYACNGRGPDTYGFFRAMRGAIGYSLFKSIHDAFLAKSNHERDELGFSWVDLSPHYKTYGRLDAREGIPLPGPKYRPTLTPVQDKAWRGAYARLAHKSLQNLTSKREKSHMSRKKLKALKGQRRIEGQQYAAAGAWTFVKNYLGAEPLIDLVPPRKVPLLIKTGRLERSLAPAPLTSSGDYKPTNADQVFRIKQSELTLGSSVPYADFVDEKRNLWPPNPSIWMERAMLAGSEAVRTRLVEVLSQGP